MSTRLNADSFIATVQRSGLVTAERLQQSVEGFTKNGGDRTDPLSLANHFVNTSLVTRWQAEKLLQGKHKGYFLGKYRLLSLLGKGGMSSVYLAEHTLMRRRCAIKVLPAKRVADSSYLARFHREAQAVAALDDPNIVRAYDVDHQIDGDNEIHFLVMEYVDGCSLHELVQRQGPLRFEDAVEYGRQAALGLAHAHAAGMVHRDIKPGNLLVDTTGTVKVLDLGLARYFDSSETGEALTIAHDEKVLGTADYLAPEQAIDSHTVDARADIYSLGCTMYYTLTGHPPFTEGSLAQRLLAHQYKEPAALETERAGIPESLAELVRKLMAKKADDRFADATQTAQALLQWLSDNARDDWRATHASVLNGRGSKPLLAAPVAKVVSRPGTPVQDPPTEPLGSHAMLPGFPSPQAPASVSEQNSLVSLFGQVGAAPPPAATPATPPPAAGQPPGSASSKPPGSKPPGSGKPPASGSQKGRSGRSGTSQAAGKSGTNPVAKAGTTPSLSFPTVETETVPVGAGLGNFLTEIGSPPPIAPPPASSIPTQPRGPKSASYPQLPAAFSGLPISVLAAASVAGVAALVVIAWLFGAFGHSESGIETVVVPEATTPAVVTPPVVSQPAAPAFDFGSTRRVTVGTLGADYKTIGEALAAVRKGFHPAGPKDRFTVEILAGDYAERIVVDGVEEPFPDGVTLRGSHGTTLLPAGTGPQVELHGVKRFELEMIDIDATAKPVGIELTGSLAGTRLSGLTLRGFVESGISVRGGLGEGFQQAQLVFEQLRLLSGSPEAAGIRLGPADGRDPAHIVIEDCRLMGPLAVGLTVMGERVTDIALRRSLITQAKIAVQFGGPAVYKEITVSNVTIHGGEQGIAFTHMPLEGSRDLSLRRNLFLNLANVEGVVERDYNADAFRAMLLEAGQGLELNWSTRPPAAAPVPGEIDLFASFGHRGDISLPVESEDPVTDNFLVPAEGSPQVSGEGSLKAGEKPWIGARGR